MLGLLREIKTLSKCVGLISALRIKIIHGCALALCSNGWKYKFGEISVTVNVLSHPIFLRPATSDYDVFRQIYVENEYKPLDNVMRPNLIIDCGANVGYSSAYFLSHFPSARLIAFEPDPDNATMCRKNLLPYGDRAQVFDWAIWSHPAQLTLLHFGKFGDLGEHGVQVFEAPAMESGSSETIIAFPEHVHRGSNPPICVGEVDAIDLATVFEIGGKSPIDILKMDIEKAELEIFKYSDHNSLSWLDHVNNIVIELHGSEARTRFFRALQTHEYEHLTSGELTICRNLRRRERTIIA